MPQPRARVYGPLVSTVDLDAHERLFCDVFAMAVAEDLTLAGDLARAVFDVPAGIELTGARVRVLRTPGLGAAAPSGVVLVRFEPGSEETVRDWDSRVSRDALKVIDFYAPDYEGAIARARRLGYEVIESEASYELPEGEFREAHLWAPDNVVTAFLGGPATFFADFAQVTDAVVSEVQSISAPVSDAQPSVDFYREVFGWDVVYEYAIDDPSFAEMLGVDELRLRSRNVGPSTVEPYVGLIDYGLPAGHDGSLAGRSQAPRRGLLGAVLLSDDLAPIAEAAADAAGPRTDATVLGRAGTLLVRTPHAVPHLVLGPPIEPATD